MALPAVLLLSAAAARLLLTAGLPAVQQSIEISWPPGPRQQTDCNGVRRPGGTDTSSYKSVLNLVPRPKTHFRIFPPQTASFGTNLHIARTHGARYSLMGLLQLRYEHDSSTIRARYNILRGVMCFRAIMNMSTLSCCCRML